jgi:hypothetical protein
MIDYYFSGDYLGMLMFDNFGLQKYSFANLNFQTLWARSSKEWEYICYGHSCYDRAICGRCVCGEYVKWRWET